MQSVNGTDAVLYQKMYFSATTRSDSTLAKEESLDSSTQNSGIKISAQSKLTMDSKDISVLFNDPISGERVNLRLNKENMGALQEKFDKDNFYLREDGIMRLSGKAESYISGWYGEIAYNMNANNADMDKNGVFNKAEATFIKNDYDFKVTDDHAFYKNSISVYGVQSYQQGEVKAGERTIDDILNGFIAQDKDLNGKITFKENVEQTQGSLYSTLKDILQQSKNPFEGIVEATTPKDKKAKDDEEDVSKEEAMQLLAKIKQSGDLSTLSPEEQAAVQKYFTNEVEKIKQETNDADTINKRIDNLIENIAEQLTADDSLIFTTKA